MGTVLYFVSGHGFGHAVRSAQVVRALWMRGHRCEIVSSAPRWIFEVNLQGVPFGYRVAGGDPGVAQEDSLRNDIPATRRNWEEYIAQAEPWLEEGLTVCRELKPSAIAGDAVPLAPVLARRAGIPSFMVTTFTWDWILDFYADDDPAFAGIAAQIREWYLAADAVVFTPFAFGLPDIRPAYKVPLIGKRAARPKGELRRQFGWDDRPTVLVSFGGCGAKGLGQIGFESFPDYRFVMKGEGAFPAPNVTIMPEGVAHEDLVTACDAVLTKPGYGICSECALNRIPMLYTSRGKFAEYDPLVKEMQTYFPAAHIPLNELFGGGLGAYLGNLPVFGPEHITDPGTGAEEAAHIIAGLL